MGKSNRSGRLRRERSARFPKHERGHAGINEKSVQGFGEVAEKGPQNTHGMKYEVIF